MSPDNDNLVARTSCRFRVSGRVQGVFFRVSARQEALRLGLAGWVRNCSDGRVEGVAQGDVEALDEFRAWLAGGPPHARVDTLEWSPVADEILAGFRIR